MVQVDPNEWDEKLVDLLKSFSLKAKEYNYTSQDTYALDYFT
jgi:hypothetical protein